MQSEQDQNLLPDAFPVSIMMERIQVSERDEVASRWQLLGVIAGQNFYTEKQQCRQVYSSKHSEQFLWTGYILNLHKDGGESYWYNLTGKIPSVFVICRQDEEDEDKLIPFLVTLSSDEACAYEEADDLIFSAPMPGEIYHWLEQYVMENYKPVEKKKRTRKKWLEESDGEQRSPNINK